MPLVATKLSELLFILDHDRTDLPGCLWLSFQNTVVKVAPERVRPASEEEQLSLSGWMNGISQAREAFEKAPKRGYLDLTKHSDPVVFSDN